MKKITFAAVIASLIAAVFVYAQPTTVISFGPTVTVLNTTSTGAVTGTTYALPGGNANVLTWQLTASGSSAISASLQASLDGTNWITVSTCTTASGCIYNTGVNAYVFVRTTQTSRTGGTSTVATINTDRAYGVANGINPVLSGNLLFSTDGAYNIGTSTSGSPNQVWATLYGLRALGGAALSYIQGGSGGHISMLNAAGTDFGLLRFGGSTSSFPALKRSGAAIQVRLADDSGYAALSTGNISINGTTLQVAPSTFAGLSADANGTLRYCSDCLANSNPCTGASTGAFAKRLNGAWDCR